MATRDKALPHPSRQPGRAEHRASRGWLALPGAIALALATVAVALLMPRGTPPMAQACTGSARSTGTAVGQCAPDFTLPDINGHRVSLASFHGHPVLVHFWAVGCMTCAAEYPDFQRAVRAYIPKGVAVLDVDAWGEPPGLIRAWQRTHHLPATLLVDTATRVPTQYNVPGTPTTFFVDRTGRIRAISPGPLRYEGYRRQIDDMLSAAG